MLHNSHEFLPFVIYLKSPKVEDPDAITKENGESEKSETEPPEEPLIQTTVSVSTIVRTKLYYDSTEICVSKF